MCRWIGPRNSHYSKNRRIAMLPLRKLPTRLTLEKEALRGIPKSPGECQNADCMENMPSKLLLSILLRYIQCKIVLYLPLLLIFSTTLNSITSAFHRRNWSQKLNDSTMESTLEFKTFTCSFWVLLSVPQGLKGPCIPSILIRSQGGITVTISCKLGEAATL